MSSPPGIVELWKEILDLSRRLRDVAEHGAPREMADLLEKRQALMDQVDACRRGAGTGGPAPGLGDLVREVLELQRETEALLGKKVATLTADIKDMDRMRQGNISYLRSMLSSEPLILDRKD